MTGAPSDNANNSSADRHARSSQLILWIGLLVAWIAMLWLIDPRGEFPLNDDWAYARAVKTLHDTGQMELPTYWASMTLVGHVIWGWLITAPFGFSLLALRLWNLVPALMGIVGVYVVMREAKLSRSVAWIAAAATAFNAVYANLTVSFMTDITFFSAGIWSAIFFLRSLRTNSRFDFWIGLALSLIALTIRQHGVFIAVAWGIVYGWREGWKSKSLFLAAFPLGLHCAYLIVHSYVFGPIIGSTSFQSGLQQDVSGLEQLGLLTVLRKAFGRAATVWIYAGVLSLPVWLHMLLTEGRTQHIKFRLKWGLAGWAAVAVLIPTIWQMRVPWPTNIVYDLGIGPPTLRDTYVLWMHNLPQAPRSFWILITAVGIFGGGLVVARWLHLVIQAIRKRLTSENDAYARAFVFITVFSAGCLVLFAVLPMYDRYMITFLPLLCLVTATRQSEANTARASLLAPSLIALVAIAAFSTAGVHDYFAWNRARWTALEWLTETQRVTPYEVDGGFEYHGWMTYEPGFQAEEGKSWWWVTGDDYVISFGTMPGYDEVSAFAYNAWLPPGERAVYVLHRAADLDQAALIND